MIRTHLPSEMDQETLRRKVLARVYAILIRLAEEERQQKMLEEQKVEEEAPPETAPVLVEPPMEEEESAPEQDLEEPDSPTSNSQISPLSS